MPDITRNNIIIALIALGAILLAGLMVTLPLSGPAQASTVRHHHKMWYCAARDYGNIRTELSGKSYVCQRDGKRYAWQIIRERIEN